MRLIFIIISYFFLQFANKISEKLLGYRINELWGKNITDLILYDNFIQMEQHIVKGREYDGNINCIRRNNQMLTINCRVIPFAYFKWVKLDLSFKKKKRRKKKKEKYVLLLLIVLPCAFEHFLSENRLIIFSYTIQHICQKLFSPCFSPSLIQKLSL